MLGGGGGGGSSGADAGFVGRVGGGVAGVERLLPWCIFWPVGSSGLVGLFSSALALAGPEVVGLGGARGLKKGCVARLPGSQSGRLPGCFRVIAREVDELAYGLRGVCGQLQCGRAVVERVVEVVVRHGFGLFDPGLRGF